MPAKLLKNKLQRRILGTMDLLYISATHVMFSEYWDKYGNPFDEETFESVIFLAECTKLPSHMNPVTPKRWALEIEALFHSDNEFELLEIDWDDEKVFNQENGEPANKILFSKAAVVDLYKKRNAKDASNIKRITLKNKSNGSDSEQQEDSVEGEEGGEDSSSSSSTSSSDYEVDEDEVGDDNEEDEEGYFTKIQNTNSSTDIDMKDIFGADDDNDESSEIPTQIDTGGIHSTSSSLTKR